MLVGCEADNISDVSTPDETLVTLSEEEDAALAKSMQEYLYENLSEECLAMVDDDSFGFFIGHFDGGWDISMCVKERTDVIPATKELYEVLRNRCTEYELTMSEISVKYYKDTDHDDMLIFKLTDGDGVGTLTDNKQPDEQRAREDVNYDEIELYVDKNDGSPIDVPIETDDDNTRIIVVYK